MIERNVCRVRNTLEPWAQEIVNDEITDTVYFLVQEVLSYAVADSSVYYDIKDAVWGWGGP